MNALRRTFCLGKCPVKPADGIVSALFFKSSFCSFFSDAYSCSLILLWLLAFKIFVSPNPIRITYFSCLQSK
jgi:hypothetical protein